MKTKHPTKAHVDEVAQKMKVQLLPVIGCDLPACHHATWRAIAQWHLRQMNREPRKENR